MTTTVLHGDCRAILPTLADASVHCVVTSPPYWGLRDYGVANQLGLEASPEEYIATLVGVFREVRRVLRADGTLWLNMGDSYAGGGTLGRNDADRNFTGGGGNKLGSGNPGNGRSVSRGGKPKDLMMVPARVALALQADGWWLRSDIIWAKPNPMPESVTDRPTSAHEHIFLLTKSARYFFDSAAIAEASVSDHRSGNGYARPEQLSRGGRGQVDGWEMQPARNCRNVWEIATSPFPDAHFATFPPALVERCIKAGTSERGCCAACGAPWVRETSVSYTDAGNGNNNMARKGGDFVAAMSARPYAVRKLKDVETTGWRSGCACPEAPTVPATVLDCFAGAGTTLLVADRLQRDGIGIELNPAYASMATARVVDDAPLFAGDVMPVPVDSAEARMADLFAARAEQAAD